MEYVADYYRTVKKSYAGVEIEVTSFYSEIRAGIGFNDDKIVV
jgi:hypothetical protein